MATYSRSNTALPLPITEWNAVTAWSGATVLAGGTVVNVTNSDGTLTQFVGSGFTLDGSGNATGGTVITINRYTAGGVSLLETASGLSLALTAAQTQTTNLTLLSTAFSAGETFAGGVENDTLFGYAGVDTFNTSLSTRNIYGNQGDNYIGGAGNDIFNVAADGSTSIIYALDGGPGGVSGTLTTTGGTLTDTFGNSDTIAGGNAQFVLTAAADNLTLGTGDDFVQPGAGADTINMGTGFDELSYAFSATSNTYFANYLSGITVNFSSATQGNGTVTDPTGATDTFTGVESVRGTQFADTFNGSSFNDNFRGQGGADTYNGGAGFDTVRFDREIRSGGLTGVTVNLANNFATDSFNSNDMLFSIESIWATKFNDNLTGSSASESFRPFEGDDTINGGGGFDDLIYGSGLGAGGNPTGTIGITVTMGAAFGQGVVTSAIFGTDTFTNIERVWGTQLNDTFIGGAFNDYFVTSLGTDSVSGGSGFDQLGYDEQRITNTGFGVSITMTGQGTGTVTKAGGVDTFTSIEQIIGSDLADVFTGGTGNDDFIGNRGADSFNGGGGIDWVSYNYDNSAATQGAVVNLANGTATDQFGFTDTIAIGTVENVRGTSRTDYTDTLTGDGNDNTFRGYGGNDTINGAGGSDTVDYSGDIDNGGFAAVGVYLSSNLAVDGNGTFDTITNVENVIGTNVNAAGYNDIIFGTSVANSVDARGGGDIVVAYDGADTVYGGTGTDAIYGGEGGDVLVGSNFTSAFNGEIDYLIGEGGGDYLYAGSVGNAYMDGGTGNDFIYGGTATDYILSGAGSDNVTLGGGVDLAIIYAPEQLAGDVDYYLDFTDGQDFIYMSGSLAASTTFGDGAGYSYMASNVSGGTHYTIFYGVTAAQISDQIFFNL